MEGLHGASFRQQNRKFVILAVFRHPLRLKPGFHKVARRRRVSRCVAKTDFCNQWKPSILDSAAPCDTLRHSATLCDNLRHSATICDTLRHSAKPSHFMETRLYLFRLARDILSELQLYFVADFNSHFA